VPAKSYVGQTLANLRVQYLDLPRVFLVGRFAGSSPLCHLYQNLYTLRKLLPSLLFTIVVFLLWSFLILLSCGTVVFISSSCIVEAPLGFLHWFVVSPSCCNTTPGCRTPSPKTYFLLLFSTTPKRCCHTCQHL